MLKGGGLLICKEVQQDILSIVRSGELVAGKSNAIFCDDGYARNMCKYCNTTSNNDKEECPCCGAHY